LDLIAAQRRGTNARLMELDPKYADVIVKRWQEYTGKPALLDDDGGAFEAMSEERV
jgi:DNA modification methylase